MKKIIVILILCLTPITPALTTAQTMAPAANGYSWLKMTELQKGIYIMGFLNGHLAGFIEGQDRVGKRTSYPGSKEAYYYVKEVDEFLRTYPLCNKVKLHILFPALTLVWFKAPDGPVITYKKIGEDCSEGFFE